MNFFRKGRGISLLVFFGLISFCATKAVNINVNIPGASVTNDNPAGIVANFYSFALLIGGVLAFGAIVWGGVQYALSAGNPSGQSEGKEWIVGALLGLLLLSTAYLILNVINPNLVKLTIPTLSPLPSNN